MVVSCGHTDATAAEAVRAFDRGVHAVTHLFNAMRPFGHRDPGLAGAALCPIYSVNPGMGSGFIVDSFMVVVLGGVGSLAGTLVAALGVGGANVLIEPISGAVAAKVIVLVGIILFLQRRPEGLFAVRRRR